MYEDGVDAVRRDIGDTHNKQHLQITDLTEKKHIASLLLGLLWYEYLNIVSK